MNRIQFPQLKWRGTVGLQYLTKNMGAQVSEANAPIGIDMQGYGQVAWIPEEHMCISQFQWIHLPP